MDIYSDEASNIIAVLADFPRTGTMMPLGPRPICDRKSKALHDNGIAVSCDEHNFCCLAGRQMGLIKDAIR